MILNLFTSSQFYLQFFHSHFSGRKHSIFIDFLKIPQKLFKMYTARLLMRLAPRQMTLIRPRVRTMSALPFPESESTPIEAKNYPEKIVKIVDDISHLTLLEVADLNELLKSRLKITDAPVMMAGAFAGGPAGGAAAPAAEEEEEAAPAVAVQV